MEAVRTLQLAWAVEPSRFTLLGDFNAHIGTECAGVVPEEYCVAARQSGFRGFPLLSTRHSRCQAALNPRGQSLLRRISSEHLLVLNGRSARDSCGAITMVWQ